MLKRYVWYSAITGVLEPLGFRWLLLTPGFFDSVFSDVDLDTDSFGSVDPDSESNGNEGKAEFNQPNKIVAGNYVFQV